MANQIATDLWKEQCCLYISANATLQIGLYTNSSYTWSHSSVYSDLTQPTGGTWYSLQTCSSWLTPALDGSNDAYINATAVSWTNTTSSTTYTIYGSFIYDSASGVLAWGQNWSAPLSFTPGMQITLPAQFQTQSQF
jgi:hypothetical protein